MGNLKFAEIDMVIQWGCFNGFSPFFTQDIKVDGGGKMSYQGFYNNVAWDFVGWLLSLSLDCQ